MRAYEHRVIGDTATGAAVVNIGGETVDERFVLSFGDVVSLSGDFFRPYGSPTSEGEGEVSGRLFSLAAVEGMPGSDPTPATTSSAP